MSKYELAVVVNAQIDDETRTAVVDRCKDLIARFGGEVGEVEDWDAHYGQCHQISVC